jgi:S-adenosylmethionine decarboxylase
VYEVPGVVGRHCIYELQGGDPHLLDDEDFIKDAMKQAAEASGATLLGMVSHKFEPQGVTAVALLSESHISIHSWPEHGYAAVDAFTCGEHTNPEAACRSLREALKATSGSMKLLARQGDTVNRRQLLGALP